jgi:hypothetical protein
VLVVSGWDVHLDVRSNETGGTTFVATIPGLNVWQSVPVNSALLAIRDAWDARQAR